MLHKLNAIFPVRYTALALCAFALLLSLFALLAFGTGLGAWRLCVLLFLATPTEASLHVLRNAIEIQ